MFTSFPRNICIYTVFYTGLCIFILSGPRDLYVFVCLGHDLPKESASVRKLSDKECVQNVSFQRTLTNDQTICLVERSNSRELLLRYLLGLLSNIQFVLAV